MEKANIAGTKGALDFAEAVDAGCFHLVSSIAAAGLYRGTFTEDMFEEAEDLDHPYHRTKHDSEAMVRANGRIPFRIYRPGVVLGHSQTGFIDKIDGPYYFFKALQRLRESWPRWMPLVGVEGGYVNVVPVDFVVDALVHLSHLPKLDGRCFHLTDPKVRRVGEMLNVFARAAHAPEMAFRLDPKVFALVPEPIDAVDRAQQADPERLQPGAARPAGAALGAAVHQLPDALRFHRHARSCSTRPRSACRRSRTTPGACGTTGSATSIPTCRSTAA